MTGTAPRTAAGALMRHGNSTSAVDVDSIRAAAKAFIDVARAHDEFDRERRAALNNTHGRKLKELGVGDYVKMYRPPSHAEAMRRNRKAKHLMCWHGPMRIVEHPSASKFVLVDHFDSTRRFERNISNIRAWRGPLPATRPSGTASAVTGLNEDERAIGSFLLAHESEETAEVVLACVTDSTDLGLTVHCYGSRSKDVKTAVFHPIYIDTDGGVLLGKPGRGRVAQPWTWDVAADDYRELIAVDGLFLTRGKKLNAASKRRVDAAEYRVRLRAFSRPRRR